MTHARWERLEPLLERAAELSAAERDVFVESATEGDPALRAELLALLDASTGAEAYLGELRRDLLGSGWEGLLRDAPADPASPDPWIGRTVRHYEIVDRIGDGGMGVIYRARDAKLDRTVALKFIAPEIRRDPQAADRFLREARAASALDHPNICTIHDIAETEDGRMFMVMAAYDGETLRARIARAPMTEAEALQIAEQVAQALAAAHERGIFHRDVKPENVFLTREGVVKLLDFGLARHGEPAVGPEAREGTVAYMSPEQADGRAADERSDVWALGATLFEMLTGGRPFTAESPAATLQLIRTREPSFGDARRDLAPDLVGVVERSLAKDTDRRFANGRELLRALQACRVAPAWRPRRRRPPRRMTVAVGGLAALALATALALRPRPAPSGPEPALPPGAVSHVLWVDDNPENNADVMRMLSERGVQVTTARSTDEALRVYDPAAHHFVVSDMGRYEGPDEAYVERAGFLLLEELRARRPDVRLAYCTSSRGATTNRDEALAVGAVAIIEDCGGILALIGL